MDELLIERMMYIKRRAYMTDEHMKEVWDNYEPIFGAYVGNKSCQDCVREALKKLIIELQNS